MAQALAKYRLVANLPNPWTLGMRFAFARKRYASFDNLFVRQKFVHDVAFHRFPPHWPFVVGRQPRCRLSVSHRSRKVERRHVVREESLEHAVIDQSHLGWKLALHLLIT
jgi:hypothetical protein